MSPSEKGLQPLKFSTKILDRVIEMSTNRGDIVMDPFGGSGTTFAVCEKKGREWVGTEIDYANEIIDRLESKEISSHRNDDFIEPS
jgi:site-specific DNA-methyltransferase (adenine-specific)